jgi:hypothetical protein
VTRSGFGELLRSRTSVNNVILSAIVFTVGFTPLSTQAFAAVLGPPVPYVIFVPDLTMFHFF